MSSSLNIIDSLIINVFKALSSSSSTDPSITEKISFDCNKYLVENWPHVLHLFRDVTKKNPILVFRFLLSQMEQLISEIQIGYTSIYQLKQISVLSYLCHNSFAKLEPNEAVLNEERKIRIIDLCVKVYEGPFEPNMHIVSSPISQMLVSLSKQTKSMYEAFSRIWQVLFLTEPTHIKVKASMDPWIYITSDVSRLSSFLKILSSNLTLVTSNHYKFFLKLISTIVLNVINSSRQSYIQFLEDGMNMMVAQQTYSMIDQWNVTPQTTTWIAQFSLLLLQPNAMNEQSNQISLPLINKILNYKTIKQTIDTGVLHAVLVGFVAIARSGPHPILVKLMSHFTHIPLQFLEQNVNNIKSLKDPLPNMLLVDFPLALLISNHEEFSQKMVPFFSNTKNPEIWCLFSVFITKICRFTIDSPYSFQRELDILIPLLSQCMLLASSNSSFVSAVSNLISGLSINSFFCRLIMSKHPSFFPSLIELIIKYELSGIEDVVFSLYDMKYSEDYQHDGFWDIIISIFNILESVYVTKYYMATDLCKIHPRILDRILKYINTVIHGDSGTLDPSSDEEIKLSLQIELQIILILVNQAEISPNSILSIVNSYLIITQQFHNLNDKMVQPNVFNSFLVYFEGNQNLLSSFASVFRSDNEPSLAVLKAHSVVFSWFSSFTDRFIDIPDNPDNKQRRKSLFSIWAGCFVIITSVTRKFSSEFLILIQKILKEKSDLSRYLIKILPKSLCLTLFNNFQFTVYCWIRQEIENSKYLSQSSVFVECCMDLLSELHIQDNWRNDIPNSSTISDIIHCCAQYCHIISCNSSRISCCKLITALFTFSRANSIEIDPIIRHITAKNMLQWIPNDTPNDIGNINTIFLSLGDLLSGLSFLSATHPVNDEFKASDHFTMFFTFLRNSIAIYKSSINQILSVLSGMLRSNFSIGIHHFIVMGYSDSPIIRSTILSSIKNSFNSDEYKKFVSEKNSTSLIDIILGDDFQNAKLLCKIFQSPIGDDFASLLLESAAYKGVEFGLIQAMIDVELSQIDEMNYSNLFKGNNIPSKVLSHYPKLLASSWLSEIILPFVIEIVEISKNGEQFQIDPDRLGPSDNLEKNQKAFSKIVIDIIDTICDSISSMPPGLLKVAQMIYKSVQKDSKPAAIQAMSGLIFQRFLCPSISMPANLGYSHKLSDDVRSCLIHLSVFLMNAAAKPSIDQKRPYFSPFSDLHHLAYNRFIEMYNIITSETVGDIPRISIINYQSVTHSLYRVLFPCVQLIENFKVDNNIGQEHPINMLLQKLREMSIEKNLLDSFQIKDKNESTISDSMQHVLNRWFFKSDKFTTDGSVIYYLCMTNLSRPIHPSILLLHIRKSFEKNNDHQICIVADLGGFNIAFLPDPNSFKPIADEFLGYYYSKIMKVYIVRAQSNILTFLNSFFTIFKGFPKPSMIDTLELYQNNIGRIDGCLVDNVIESFSLPESIHPVVVNQREGFLRIHSKSLQIIYQNVLCGSYRISTNDILFFQNIDCLEQTKSSNNRVTFLLRMKTGENYHVITTKGSGLYSLLVSVLKDESVLQATRKLLYIEKNAIHAYLINLSLHNMINNISSQEVINTSIELFRKVLESCDLKFSLNFSQFERDDYPLLSISLGKEYICEIAKQNQDQIDNFLIALSKVISFMQTEDSALTSELLYPWIKFYSKEILSDSHRMEFIYQIVSCVSPYRSTVFNQRIWKQIDSPYLLKFILDKDIEVKEKNFSSIFNAIASNNPKLVSKFFTDQMLSLSNNERLTMQLCSLISQLINDGLFLNSYMSQIVYIVCKIRISIPQYMSTFLFNLFSSIYCRFIGFLDLAENDFSPPSKFSSDYSFYAINTYKIALKCFQLSTKCPFEFENLYMALSSDVQSNDSMIRHQALLYICPYFSEFNNKYADFLMKELYVESSLERSMIEMCLIKTRILSNHAENLLLYSMITSITYYHHLIYDIMDSSLDSIFSSSKEQQQFSFSTINDDLLTKAGNILDLPLKEDLVLSIISILFYLFSTKGFNIKPLLVRMESYGIKHVMIDILLNQYKFDISQVDDNNYKAVCFVMMKMFLDNPNSTDIRLHLETLLEIYPDMFASMINNELINVLNNLINPDCASLVLELSKLKSREIDNSCPYFSSFMTKKDIQVSPKSLLEVYDY